ncbi:MAG: class I SAM-dependent rRNA methyltransferase [Candidatus Kapabacteria bacterium]|nr:class I SAM-dependent rRNA methyltransferase [Candidatus Kapabacteria bacterium]
MDKIVVKKNSQKRLKKGSLWIYSNELTAVTQLPAGTTVEVISEDGNNYGVGFYNPNSLITVRLLLSEKEPDLHFFKTRIEKAKDFRKRIYQNSLSYRLVFGESDLLPGLIIDKYDNYFALQFFSAGMELRKELIIESLLSLFPHTKGIIEKNSFRARKNEGLTQYEKIVFGEIPDEITIEENSIKYSFSLLDSQKTGFFLDQKDNRLIVRRISKDLKVLDCYCNLGGFALNAAFGGAKSVVGIDSSEKIIEFAQKNAVLNKIYNVNFIKSDVEKFLNNQLNSENYWDMIILDPPSFAHSKKDVAVAKRGYSKINNLALRLLKSGSWLVTSSCTQYIYEDIFYEIIRNEAAKLKKQLRLVFRGMQAPDHPILESIPETKYLKFLVFQVL